MKTFLKAIRRPGGREVEIEHRLGLLRIQDLDFFDSSLRGTPIIYEPRRGETIVAVLPSDVQGEGGREYLLFGTADQFASVLENDEPDYSFAYVTGPGEGQDGFGIANQPESNFFADRFLSSDAPLRAAVFNGGVILPENTDWQANHTYLPNSCVIALVDQGSGLVPTLYITEEGGISGSTTPEWTINPILTEDGTISWSDRDFLSGISCRVRLLIAAKTS